MSIVSDKMCAALDEIRAEIQDNKTLENLKKIIEEGISHIKAEKKVELLLDEASSRVKGIKSFKEKIARKNYLNDWGLNDNSSPDECKNTVRKKLSDLIDIRINCFFKDDEKIIYKGIIEYLRRNPYLQLPPNPPEEGEEQKNGNVIYKLSCIYKNDDASLKYPFELQIKSFVHNLWGEVEHEIGYKAEKYDYNFLSKKEQLECIFSSLKASDSQLRSLYKVSYTEPDLINSLFFIYTNSHVISSLNEKNPTYLYCIFFRFFKRFDPLIKKYVACIMSGGTAPNKKVYGYTQTNIFQFFSESILKHFFSGLLDDLYAIFSILFSNGTRDDMSLFVANEVLSMAMEKMHVDSPHSDNEDDDDDNTDFDATQDDDSEPEFLTPEPFHKKEKSIIEYIKSTDRFSHNEKNILIKGVDIFCRIICEQRDEDDENE